MHTLHNGDALEWMKSLPAASVDCVFVDLPYFGVMADDWDNQWKDRNEYLDWVVSLAHEWKRITKSNSSIFLFCDEKMEAYIQVRLDEIFLLLNKIVWYRKTNEMKKYAKNFRVFAPATERALYYAYPENAPDRSARIGEKEMYAEIKNYFREQKKEMESAGLNIDNFVRHTKNFHYFGNGASFNLPTEKDYSDLQKSGFFLKPLKDIKEMYQNYQNEYEQIREAERNKRRPFNADMNTFDVIDIPAYDGRANIEHPTVKSLPLCRRILSVITDPGQVVLDCCMGSGTAGVAALELGRHFLGCDNNPKYFAIAEKHIERAAQSPSFYTLPNNRLQPTAFGVGTQASFPLLGSSQADESPATNGGG